MGSMFNEDYCYIPPLSPHSYIFPNPKEASDEGLLAYGGDLSSSRILAAYRNGIFPWFNENDPILWWSPNPRMLLYPKSFKTSKSFARVIRNGDFRVTFDQSFEAIIKNCAITPRHGQEGTWILDSIQEAYIKLHHEGYAHSVEVWLDDKLVGGLYGISLGKVFFGESMFSHISNASKIAFRALSDVLEGRGYHFIDCQMKTDHLASMGAIEVPRDDYLNQLDTALQCDSDLGYWNNFQWAYSQ